MWSKFTAKVKDVVKDAQTVVTSQSGPAPSPAPSPSKPYGLRFSLPFSSSISSEIVIRTTDDEGDEGEPFLDGAK